MPGLTAYAGLFGVADLQAGEALFVSGGAGAVGHLVCQLALARGATVVASAGSADKVRWLQELGATAFSYRDGPVADALRAAAPDGVDVYFDNVGGEHLEAAISSLKVHGRVAVCGMISAYNATEAPAAPRNLSTVVGKRLRVQGFLVSDHADLRPAFEAEVGAMLEGGGWSCRRRSWTASSGPPRPSCRCSPAATPARWSSAPDEAGVGRLAETSLERLGDHRSLVFEGEDHTASALHGRAVRIAGGFAGLGVRPGDRVAVCMTNCPEVLLSYAALWRRGGAHAGHLGRDAAGAAARARRLRCGRRRRQ